MRLHTSLFLRWGLLVLVAGIGWAAYGQAWTFTEVTDSAGVRYEHGYGTIPLTEPAMMCGGVAAGDYDGDGWVDLYAVAGTVTPNRLFRNLGDGTFEEVAAAAGVAVAGERGSGPNFGDLDGDGWLDLMVGGIGGTAPRVFRNLGDGSFEETTGPSGIRSTRDTFSIAFGDIDLDGDLDAFLSHWGVPGSSGHLWQNRGDGTFADIDASSGLGAAFAARDFSFTPNFSDIDGDSLPDLLLAADFGTSQVFRNLGDGRFGEITGPEITDENGMGAAVGDYDRDGDLDWFVSSIWDPDGVVAGNWGITGNRLYRNRGDGTFEDATDEAGVRFGYWGWGSCFADLNNDGWLDLFHVNGMPLQGADEFFDDPARLFIAEGDGSFTERSAELGLDAPRQGRGVVCFDYDRDGDIDLFVANNDGPSRLFRNDGGSALGHFLGVRLSGAGGNTAGVGAWVEVTAGGVTQLVEIRAGSNYVSQSPAEAHFGLGAVDRVERLRVRWPSGTEDVLRDLPADRWIVVQEGSGRPSEIPVLGPLGLLLMAALLAAGGWAGLRLRSHRRRDATG
ncbi:MAG: CRTAC1 family protein [Acidobacteriota bacterium]